MSNKVFSYVLVSLLLGSSATFAAGGGMVADLSGLAPDRYVYYPGAEALDKDELRVVAWGTGMPNQSPSNVAASFFVELGNGEVFLFDRGTGATDRLAGLEVDY